MGDSTVTARPPSSVMAVSSFQAGVKERDVRVFISETSGFGRPSSPPESGVHTEVTKTLLFSQTGHLKSGPVSVVSLASHFPASLSPYCHQTRLLISSALCLTKIRCLLHTWRLVGAHAASGEDTFLLSYSFSLTLHFLPTPQGVTTLQGFLHSFSRHIYWAPIVCQALC